MTCQNDSGRASCSPAAEKAAPKAALKSFSAAADGRFTSCVHFDHRRPDTHLKISEIVCPASK
jgi:hypothetical protein